MLRSRFARQSRASLPSGMAASGRSLMHARKCDVHRVVERAQHAGDVLQRRVLVPALVERTAGLAFEVDDDEVVVRPAAPGRGDSRRARAFWRRASRPSHGARCAPAICSRGRARAGRRPRSDCGSVSSRADTRSSDTLDAASYAARSSRGCPAAAQAPDRRRDRRVLAAKASMQLGRARAERADQCEVAAVLIDVRRVGLRRPAFEELAQIVQRVVPAVALVLHVALQQRQRRRPPVLPRHSPALPATGTLLRKWTTSVRKRPISTSGLMPPAPAGRP